MGKFSKISKLVFLLSEESTILMDSVLILTEDGLLNEKKSFSFNTN